MTWDKEDYNFMIWFKKKMRISEVSNFLIRPT